MRLIDADNAISHCKALANDKWNKKVSPVSWADAYQDFVEYLEETPTVDAVEVVRWIPVSEPPTTFRDEYGELIPFLVCEEGTEYPFRAMYDGKTWGDGFFAIPVTHWMPLPRPPRGA